MIEVKVFYWFVKALFCGLFQSGGRNIRIAGKELISKPTFRQPDSAYKDKLIGFKLLKRTWNNLSTKKQLPEEPIEILIFDGSTKAFEIRLNYLVWIKKYKPEKVYGLGRDNASNFANKGRCRILLFTLACLVMPFTIWSRNRVQWALVMAEYTEVCGLIHFVMAKQINTIHFFSPGEKDSNLIYLILKKQNYKVVKHPSPGALIAHNKYLMADVLALSSKYQEEEFEIGLKNTISVNEIEKWPPEVAFNYHELYNSSNNYNNFHFELGYYSHGGWLRKKNERTEGLFAKPEEEELCISILSEFLKKYSGLKMMIFIHPKEKKDLTKTREYYLNSFKESQVEFYIEDRPSSYVFNLVKYGIGSYSTVLFERDFYGFKTLFLYDEKKDFPLKDTTLHSCSFTSLKDLERLVF